MDVLIAGIGRSGTTTLFEVLGRACLAAWPDCECLYEPYLWNLPQARKTATAKGSPFTNENIDPFGLYVHRSVPLFLDTDVPLHHQWMERTFGPASEPHAPRVVKEIRAMGRLPAMLEARPDLRCVLVLRNPLDTINSSLGMFSFFGEEFHASDRPRFREELQARVGPLEIDWPAADDLLGWSELWVRHFMAAGLAARRRFGERIFVVPYETYAKNKSRMLSRMLDFLGLEGSEQDASLMDRPAGPTTTERYLGEASIDRLIPAIEEYSSLCREFDSEGALGPAFTAELIAKYKARPRGEMLVRPNKMSLTAVQWRTEAVKAESERRKHSESAVLAKGHQPVLYRDKRQFYREYVRERIARGPSAPLNGATPGRRGPSIGCVVTTYNSQDTIVACLRSLLSQTHPIDEILVCDDGSTDETHKLVQAISESEPRVKLVARRSNVGPSANRDLGIRALDTELFTHVDGDDEFAPTKIELELAALKDIHEDVAFSDIELVSKNGVVLQDIAALDGCDGRAAISRLISRSVIVPRDMLMSRSLYLRTGGYDYEVGLYEDWAFKLRLCLAMNGSWRHARGDVGTIYNRVQPGLSNQKPIAQVFWQLHGLSTVAARREIPDVDVLASAKLILRPLSGEMGRRAQRTLEALDSREHMTKFRKLLPRLFCERRPIHEEGQLYETVFALLVRTAESDGRWQSEQQAVAAGEGDAISFKEVRLDEYVSRENFRMLDLSLFSVGYGAEYWNQIKFKFCLTAKGRVLEFRQGSGWPAVFDSWPSTETDRFGDVLRIRDDAEMRGRIAGWPGERDRRLIQVIGHILPLAAETVATQKKDAVPAEELDTWLAEARALSSNLLA